MRTTTFIKATNITLACIVIALALSCQRRSKKDEILFNEAEGLLEQYPDSTLTLLRTITDPLVLAPEQFNRYRLLEIQAKDKSYRDIAADTLIFDVKKYYSERKQFAPAATAAFYSGRVLYEQGNVEGATLAYLEAEQLAANTTAVNLKGLIQDNLCALYMEQGLYDKAIKRGKYAVALFNTSENHKNEITAMLKVGNCFMYDEQTDSAFHYYRQGMYLADLHKIKEQQVATRQNIAVALLQVNDYIRAKSAIGEALTLSPGNDTDNAWLFLKLGDIYRMEHRNDSAMFYIEHSRISAADNPYLLLSSWELQAQIEEEVGQYAKALSSYRKYVECVFKTFDDDKSEMLLDIQNKYDYERIKSEAGRRVIRTQNIAIVLLCLFLAALIVACCLFRKAARGHRQALEAEDRVKSLMLIMRSDNEEKNQVLHDRIEYQFAIMKQTLLFEVSLNQEERKKGEKLIQKFYKIVFGEELSGKEKLFRTLDELQDGLYNRLNKQYPDLKEDELRLCCLSYEDLMDMDIAVILDTSVHMVQKRRSAIRKKTGIPPRGNFRDFFCDQFSETLRSKAKKS
ncbi:MAG: hypothetical protein LBS54_08065 [Dysgonamonadaceae bacterium]|jgi:tetratricopeptide (TPR) repeat protein|nr:hypothetical protein [Dysgonamonadaceae bacterium]